MIVRNVFSQLCKSSLAKSIFPQKVSHRHLCTRQTESLKAILPHRTDNYGALHFDTINQDRLLTVEADQFKQLVQQQLDNCSSLESPQIRSIWFRIYTQNAHLIAPLTKVNYIRIDQCSLILLTILYS